MVGDLLNQYTAVTNRLAAIRKAAVAELVRSRMSYAGIANALGVSKSMVAKIVGDEFKETMASNVYEQLGRSRFS